MTQSHIMVNNEIKKLATLALFLRIYGVLSLIIFGSLFLGFLLQIPLLAEGEPLNWTIWNGIQCGGEPCHVPPMLFIIYLVWGVFFFLAAQKPLAYLSFLNFTMWANLFHGLLMVMQALMMPEHYWSKWFTDIPFILILALGIYLWRPKRAIEENANP
ncbi:MAG: hypothetical protein HC769_11245 [Cyanobacteria bacterium CRU_2_1]|nr:hypothetical protein [Cyanobacteria bacterium RU_5_0]NJR59366.1 hypothetical protein [Cyanobacteria bacterium CRU_2_1]